jgi:3-phenylpropionate/trans-cinnamate dioxygenase ferredoxin reductase component
MVPTFAVVGANLAGGHAAHQLRRDGFDGRIVLIGAEPHLPYERPPLSKDILTGTADPEQAAIWTERDFADAGIELALGIRVTALDPRGRALALDDGRSLTVDKVLLCTGATPRRLPIPGDGLVGVHCLRDLDDAVRLRDALAPGARVVIVGAGFIGAEVAAAAVQRGCDVSLLEVAPLPLQRVLGPEVGALYAELHRQRGVDVRLGVAVEAFEGRGACERVRLGDGAAVDADLVVCGVGASPATELAERAGVRVGNGVLVDWACRTSIENVFAAGDVACRPSSYATAPIRLESFQNAQDQGIAAARAMLGAAMVFDDVPWFWSDQYDVKLQVAGLPGADAEVIWRGDPSELRACAFYLRDGIVQGAVGLNAPRDVRGAMDLIRRRAPVDRAVLTDPSVDLRKLRTPAA